MNPDFGRTADDYARYRAGFPDGFYTRLERRGIGIDGQRLLDLGTGTGTLARAFAKRGCEVTALDPSEALMDEAKRLDLEAGVSVRYINRIAEATGLPDDYFDVATAGVCWHWFDAERAAMEVRRLLVSQGRLVIAHSNWLAADGNLAEATESLIRRYCRPFLKTHASRIARAAIGRFMPTLIEIEGTGIHPEPLVTLAATGFECIESFSFDVEVPFSHEAWRGRVRTHAEVGATQNAERVARLDAELERLLSARFAADPLWVPHRIFAVIGRVP